ncbi:hypothetical protein PMIN04_005396 [Paraphaeosphaeria minitans]
MNIAAPPSPSLHNVPTRSSPSTRRSFFTRGQFTTLETKIPPSCQSDFLPLARQIDDQTCSLEPFCTSPWFARAARFNKQAQLWFDNIDHPITQLNRWLIRCFMPPSILKH